MQKNTYFVKNCEFMISFLNYYLNKGNLLEVFCLEI
jgi:hypothetical protein